MQDNGFEDLVAKRLKAMRDARELNQKDNIQVAIAQDFLFFLP